MSADRQTQQNRPARLVPGRSFPAYAFVPGRHPHPESDPAGHSYGIERTHPRALDLQDWHENETYLYGLDLFNAGYYWEAHVEFEKLWNAAGRTGTIADFLKGLIRLAAAGVKHREGNARGVQSHARGAAARFRSVEQQITPETRFLGLSLPDLAPLAETIDREGWPTDPVILQPALPRLP